MNFTICHDITPRGGRGGGGDGGGTFNVKNILMQKWSVIQNQPPLKTTSRKPPIISYERGKSLEDMLVRAKL